MIVGAEQAGCSVAIIAPRLHSNYRGWINDLDDAGFNICALVALIGPSEDHSIVSPIVLEQSKFSRLCERFGFFKGANHPNYAPSIRDISRFTQTQEISVAIVRGKLTLLSLTAFVVFRFKRVPIIIYDQEPVYRVSRRRKYRLQLFMWLLGAHQISPLLGEGMDRRGSPRRVHFVPFSFPPDMKASFRSKKADVKSRLITVGKFDSARKNIDLLLEVLADEFAHAKWELTIVGSSPTQTDPGLERIRSAVDRIGFGDRVSIRPNVDPIHMVDLYRSHDVFILAAQDEPASISVVESIGMGLNVVCSDTCGTKEYLDPSHDSVFVTNDRADLAKAIRAAIEAPLRTLPRQDSLSPYQVSRHEAVRLPDLVRAVRASRTTQDVRHSR